MKALIWGTWVALSPDSYTQTPWWTHSSICCDAIILQRRQENRVMNLAGFHYYFYFPVQWNRTTRVHFVQDVVSKPLTRRCWQNSRVQYIQFQKPFWHSTSQEVRRNRSPLKRRLLLLLRGSWLSCLLINLKSELPFIRAQEVLLVPVAWDAGQAPTQSLDCYPPLMIFQTPRAASRSNWTFCSNVSPKVKDRLHKINKRFGKGNALCCSGT